jgi:plasmid stabilization system protein ParE
VRVIWSPLAREQVADAFAYIAADRPGAALGWFERLVDAADALATLPDQGRIVPEAARESVREVLVDPYRLVYLREADQVVVLVVHHGRRELAVEDLGA